MTKAITHMNKIDSNVCPVHYCKNVFFYELKIVTANISLQLLCVE